MIRVLLAEDMHMVRGALVALLDMEADINVVAEVATGDEILSAARRFRPDVAVIDIGLPGKDGLIAVAEIQEHLRTCRTLIVTGLVTPGIIRRVLSTRVDGFIAKDAPPEALANAIRNVAAGRRAIDPDLALRAWDYAECPLTSRELEVLRLAASGADAVAIGADLFLSAGTVRNYLTSIVMKLNARTRVDAIRLAKEAGWL
ncbi:MAG TPA: response regulator transcription factor [Pseudonocardiaceae bacterium]|nr:response regulator transcription factor [Pseudonocardiaceae bacterium]